MREAPTSQGSAAVAVLSGPRITEGDTWLSWLITIGITEPQTPKLWKLGGRLTIRSRVNISILGVASSVSARGPDPENYGENE